MFACYAQRLSRLAEQCLDRRLAGRVEGKDVVQSALRTFFRRSVRGEFQIDSAAQLWQLLVKITVLKARAQARRHTAGKRDVGSEQPGSPDDWLAAAVDREPGPEEAALLTDEIRALLSGLPSLFTQVLELRLQGHSVTEIASRLGVACQAIYRVPDLLQQRLASRLSTPLRLPALIERVKIDMERQWQHGRPPSLGSSLERFPESGTAETVAADLVFAEYQIRRQFDEPVEV